MQITNSFGTFLVALVSANLATSAILPDRQGAHSGTFHVETAPNPKFTGFNGPAALAKAYAKYGVPVSAKLRAAVELAKTNNPTARSTGSAPATPDGGDLEYLVPVQIGTPAQTLNLDFDTGSSDLWVFSSELASSSRTGHDIYTASKSSTAKKLSGYTWSISYGDGSNSSGDVYDDKVTIGGLSVAKQAVEAAQKASAQFVQGANDCLVGLAFSSINTVSPRQQLTWFDNIKSSLDKPLFTADLRKGQVGSYLFGGIPSAARSVSYAPVDSSQGFWSFSTSVEGVGSFDTIADTGTTLVLGTDDLVNAYYGDVESAVYSDEQQGVLVDCDADLPDFTFTVGSGSISVPGSYVNYAEVGNGQCYGGIQSAGDIPFSIFGDIALKAAYVVFDAGQTRVGWAQKA